MKATTIRSKINLEKAPLRLHNGQQSTIDQSHVCDTTVEFATLDSVDWFNHRRLMELIGNIPPVEAEKRYFAWLDCPAQAA